MNKDSVAVTQMCLAKNIKKGFGFSEPRLFTRLELKGELCGAEMVKAVKSKNYERVVSLSTGEASFINAYNIKRVFEHEGTSNQDKENILKWIAVLQREVNKRVVEKTELVAPKPSKGLPGVVEGLSRDVKSLVKKMPKKPVADLLKSFNTLRRWLESQREYKNIKAASTSITPESLKDPEFISSVLGLVMASPEIQKILAGQHGAKLEELLGLFGKMAT